MENAPKTPKKFFIKKLFLVLLMIRSKLSLSKKLANSMILANDLCQPSVQLGVGVKSVSVIFCHFLNFSKNLFSPSCYLFEKNNLEISKKLSEFSFSHLQLDGYNLLKCSPQTFFLKPFLNRENKLFWNFLSL